MVSRLGRPTTVVRAEDEDILARLAEDYYLKGHNQAQIASRYRISRSYVSRLLQKARDLGIVEISVRRAVSRDSGLEAQLRARYGLLEAVVVTSASRDDADILRLAGQEGARLVAEHCKPDDTVAVAWGTGVRAIVEALRPGQARAHHVVPMFGGSLVPTDISAADLVVNVARLLGASYDQLHAPWIVETIDLARSLWEQPEIAGVLMRGASADVALVGVGAVRFGSSALLFNDVYLNPKELTELATSAAVGDIGARIFDGDGNPCELGFNSRIIGPDLATVARIPNVIAVATGAEKGAAIRGALRGGLIKMLVTDDAAARVIVGRAD